jgi:hypothetical protein
MSADEGEGEGRAGKPKKTRDQWAPRKDGWTGAKRRIFLDTLAATLSARRAARAAGMSYSAAFALKRRDPEFASLWRQAVIDGYSTLETMVMERSALGGAPDPEDGDPEEPPDPARMDPDLAMKLLQLKQREILGAPHKGSPPLKRATPAETDAAILRKLAALRRRLGLPPGTDEW